MEMQDRLEWRNGLQSVELRRTWNRRKVSGGEGGFVSKVNQEEKKKKTEQFVSKAAAVCFVVVND